MQLFPRVCHLRADKALRRLQRPKGAGRVYSRCLEEMHEGTALQSCASKQKGFWTCCACQGRKDIAAFQEWTESQGSRAQNGKQVCDACQRKRLLQSSLVRAAVTAQALRKRATERKRMRFVAEVWSELISGRLWPTTGTSRREKAPRLSERTTASVTYTYSCPECQAEVISTCQSGRVDQRRACGHQFRVRGGVVVKSYQHVCPDCGMIVQSSLPFGRITVAHTKPNGRLCGRRGWRVPEDA